jgi:hypothetical protein
MEPKNYIIIEACASTIIIIIII